MELTLCLGQAFGFLDQLGLFVTNETTAWARGGCLRKI